MALEIKKYLESQGISFNLFIHPPVFTVEDAQKHSQNIRGIHSKNLFLKDTKSKNFYLVILPEYKKANMSQLRSIVKEELRFASENELKEILSLTTGAVSPFGLINDEKRKVKLLIDKEVWTSEYVSFHPNINTETLELRNEDFHKYVELTGNNYILI